MLIQINSTSPIAAPKPRRQALRRFWACTAPSQQVSHDSSPAPASKQRGEAQSAVPAPVPSDGFVQAPQAQAL
jgi:hypothetical protein